MTPYDQATFDPRIADWLEDDPNDAPDQALEIVLAAFPSIKQRRASRVPRRFNMTTLPRLAFGAAAAIVVVVLGGAFLLRPPASGVAGGGPTPSPTAAPTQTPSPTPAATPVSTTGWTPFTSTWYGFSAAFPPDYTLHRATLHWDLVRDQTVFQDSIDSFTNPAGSDELEGYETRLPAGTSSDAFLQQYIAPNITANCYQTPDQWQPTTVDGHPARIATSGCSGAFAATEAIVVVGDRIFWFSTRAWDSPLFAAYLTTVRIHPETAVDEVGQVSPTP